MRIRKVLATDFDPVWEIFKEVIKTSDTYVFDPSTPKEDLQKHWFASYMETYVLELDERVVGTYIIKPNQIDLGNHIANCSYMVHPNSHGKGIGKSMCEHSLVRAEQIGYEGIQFNIVVSSNVAAVKLWQRYGFEIIGTTPNGFRHAELGMIDTYIMYKKLTK